jgi:hypothetical protein
MFFKGKLQHTIIKENEMKSKRSDIKGDFFGMKWKTRIGFWNVRRIDEEIRNAGRSWSEIKGIAGDRNAWKLFMDALYSTKSTRSR